MLWPKAGRGRGRCRGGVGAARAGGGGGWAGQEKESSGGRLWSEPGETDSRRPSVLPSTPAHPHAGQPGHQSLAAACGVFFPPLRLHGGQGADWHHISELIAGHGPAQARQKRSPRRRAPGRQQFFPAARAARGALTVVTVCGSCCRTAGVEMQGAAPAEGWQGTRSDIYLYHASGPTVLSLEGGPRAGRSGLSPSLCLRRGDSNKSANLHEVMNRHTLRKTQAILLTQRRLF